jgi:hypothetical protein
LSKESSSTIDIDSLTGYAPPPQLPLAPSESSLLSTLSEEGDLKESDIQDVENTNEEKNAETSKDEDNDVVSSKDIQFVLDTISKQAPHDKIQIKQIFYGICSSQTSTKIHHNINSKKSGEGKSYLLKLVADLSPDSFISKFNNMSDKALYHLNGKEAVKNEQTGKYEELKPIINQLESEIEELEEKIDEEKDKQSKKSLKSQIKEIATKIKILNQKQ